MESPINSFDPTQKVTAAPGNIKGSEEIPSIEVAIEHINDKSREIGLTTGIFTTIERESEVQRRADFNRRKAFCNFIENIKNHEDLPEFILYSTKKDESRYFLPKTNEIYIISSFWEGPETEKDPRLLPGSPTYVGQETVNHLIHQNLIAKTPLPGLELKDAKSKFSEEEVTSKLSKYEYRISDYDKLESLKIQEIKYLIDEIKKYCRGEHDIALLTQLQTEWGKIESQQAEEQQRLEESSVAELKPLFKQLVEVIEKQGGKVPEEILVNNGDYGDEALNKFSKRLEKLRTKEMGPIKSYYFKPREQKLEVVDIEKSSILRRMRPNEKTRRVATAREFLGWRSIIRDEILASSGISI